MLARMPGWMLSTFDSWTITLTCICERSGKRTMACRSRTMAPSSILTLELPRPVVHLVGVDHHAVLRRGDRALLELRHQPFEPRMLQFAGCLLAAHAGFGRVAGAFQVLEHLGLGELLEHVLRRLGRGQIELGPFDGELLGIQLQRRDVALAGHAFGVLQRVLGAAEVFLGDRDGWLRSVCSSLMYVPSMYSCTAILAAEYIFSASMRVAWAFSYRIFCWLTRSSIVAELSRTISSPFLTIEPSGMIHRIVLPPATWQRTSTFLALSTLPSSVTVISMSWRWTFCVMHVLHGFVRHEAARMPDAAAQRRAAAMAPGATDPQPAHIRAQRRFRGVAGAARRLSKASARSYAAGSGAVVAMVLVLELRSSRCGSSSAGSASGDVRLAFLGPTSRVRPYRHTSAAATTTAGNTLGSRPLLSSASAGGLSWPALTRQSASANQLPRLSLVAVNCRGRSL